MSKEYIYLVKEGTGFKLVARKPGYRPVEKRISDISEDTAVNIKLYEGVDPADYEGIALAWEAGETENEMGIYVYDYFNKSYYTVKRSSPIMEDDVLFTGTYKLTDGKVYKRFAVHSINNCLTLSKVLYISSVWWGDRNPERELCALNLNSEYITGFNGLEFNVAHDALFGTFSGCSNLTTFKNNHISINESSTSDKIYMENMFKNSGLIEFSGNTTNDDERWVIQLANAPTYDSCPFYNCTNLETVADIDFSSFKVKGATDHYTNLFIGCTKLANVSNVANINAAPDRKSDATSRAGHGYFYAFKDCPLTVNSCRNVFNALNDISMYPSGSYYSTYLYLKPNVLTQLPDSVKAMATSKGWILSAYNS